MGDYLMRTKLSTSSGRSKFEFEGSISGGTQLYYGVGQKTTVTKEQYQRLLSEFKGRTVKIGTSRCETPEGSLGEWINDNIQRRSLASYIVPILEKEGYVTHGLEKGTIIFK
jgi:hypothetical protein